MSIDDLARTATDQLAHSATRGLDTDDMLSRLHRSRRRRSAARALAVLLLVVLAGGVVLAQRTQPTVPANDSHDRPRYSAPACQLPTVTCLGDRRLRVDLRLPLTFTVPPSFGMNPTVTRTGVELYRRDDLYTGVAVMQDAVPARFDTSWTRDETAGVTAASMAQWLADRPFLRRTAVTPRTVAGRTVWRVTGSLRPNAELPGPPPTGHGFRQAPAFVSGDLRLGYTTTLLASATFVDQPGGGVTVIWSWNSAGDPVPLPGNDALIDALLAG